MNEQIRKNIIKFFIECNINYHMQQTPQNRMKNAEIEKKISNFNVNNVTSLLELKKLIINQIQLDIKSTANNLVFGCGNIKAPLMIIGEAPGANEDKKGIPFCGDSGQLLRNILKTIGLTEKNYYMTNVIYWRPPGNRKPNNLEIQKCKQYLEKQIQLVMPQVLLLVGSTASETLLKLSLPMKTLRKKTFEYKNIFFHNKIKSFVIFHPSYLLRQPIQKKLVYEDIIKVYNYLKKNSCIF